MVNAPMIIASTGFFLAVSSITFASDYQVRTDKTIEASAAARAAVRIGEIRGTISHDQIPAIIVPSDLKESRKTGQQNTDLSPRPSWVPPEKDEEALPPLVTREYEEDLDQTLTGSIKKPEPQRRGFMWEVFDQYGNRVPLD